MQRPGGTDYKNKNIFVGMVKPEKIMYDHLNDTKHHTTISFQEQGNKTLLTMTMTFETTAGWKLILQ